MPDEQTEEETTEPLTKQTPTVPTTELGVHGLERRHGDVRDEIVRQLEGDQKFDIYREMSENNAVINAMLRAIKLLMRQADWKVKPADRSDQAKQDADFARRAFFDHLRPGWEATLSDILSFIPYGFSVHEKVFRRLESGELVWDRLPIRRQETRNGWVFSQHGEVLGFEQWAMETEDAEKVTLPRWKFLLFRPGGSRGNPEGVSVLRGAFRSWFFRKRIEEIQCYSDDTEILTDDGWKLAKNLSKSDVIATLNPETHELEYLQPTRIHEHDYTGPMFHQESRFVDLLVTPNHRMYTRPKYKDEFEVTEARDLVKVTAYKRNAEWSGRRQDTFTIPGVEDGRSDVQHSIDVPMDLWLQFFGFYTAEGWTQHAGKNTVGIAQKDPDNVAWFRGVLEKLPFNYWTKETSGKGCKFFISNRQLHEYLDQFGKAGDKHIPKRLKSLCKDQLQILYDALLRGDGTCPAGTNQYITTSPQLRDDVAEIILKLGGAPNVHVKREVGQDSQGRSTIKAKNWSKCWIVTETAGWDGGNLVNSHGTDQREWVDYDGKVYCPEMPRNHLVYARRNGKSCWSGNSIGIERDLAGLPKMEVPPEILNADSGREADARDKYEQMLKNIRQDEQAGIMIPRDLDENGDNRYLFELVSSSGDRQFDTREIIAQYDDRIAMTVLADFLMLGQETHGSFALASSKTNMFAMALEAWLDIIEDTFNEDAIPQLFRLNGRQREDYPKLRHDDIEKIDLGVLGEYVERLFRAGFDFSGEEDIRQALLEQADMPPETGDGSSDTPENRQNGGPPANPSDSAQQAVIAESLRGE